MGLGQDASEEELKKPTLDMPPGLMSSSGDSPVDAATGRSSVRKDTAVLQGAGAASA